MAASAKRSDYLDNLRVFLTALVVLHHTAIACGAPGSWYYRIPLRQDLASQVLLTLFVAVNQAFFMSLFFFLAACFVPQSYDRKGPARFYYDRLKRLGIPLLAFVFLLQPLLVYLLRYYKGALTDYNLWRFFLQTSGRCGPGPLWFVFALLLFSVAYLLYRLRGRTLRTPEALRCFPANRLLLCAALLAGVCAFLLRFLFPTGATLFSLQLGYFPLYILFFGAGLLAARHNWLGHLPEGQVRCWRWIALAAVIVLLLLLGLHKLLGEADDRFNGGLYWQALAYALWEPFIAIGISLALLDLFQRRLNQPSALNRELAKAAYTIYILHPFIVIPFSYACAGMRLSGGLCFILLAPAALCYCVLFAAPIRRLPGLRGIL